MKLSRRTTLKGLSAFAWIPFMRALEVSAAGSGPLRFVGMYYPHGATSGLYARKAAETETQFDLTYPECTLQPFDDAVTYGRSFKDKLLTVENIDLSAAIAASKTGHDAPPTLFTGCGGRPANPSIDQYLAVNAALGASTRTTSIVLAVGYDSPDLTSSISYGAGGATLSKIIDPVQTFTSLFGGFVPPAPAGSTGPDPAVQQKLVQQWQQGKSVLDFLNADLARLSARLAAPEKLKLDQHASALRDLEKRLGDSPAAPPPPAMQMATCTLPARPQTFSQTRSWNNGEPNFEAISNLQVDLLAQALACDLTRFATLFLNDLSRGATTGTGITLPNDVHNDVAHQYSPTSTASWSPLGKQNGYTHSKCARLLKRCNELGILDDVGVLMTTDMGDPAAHSSRNVPTLLAGGWGGKFRMGRRVKLTAATSNARVLVSIAQAFGQTSVTTFGNGPDNTGDLAELH